MNKRYTVLLAGLLAVTTMVEAATAKQAVSLKSRLSSMLAATRSSSTGNTLLTYGFGGVAWVYASKYLADKKYLSDSYPTLIAYDIAVAGSGELLDGTIPGAGTVSNIASEAGYLYTVSNLLSNELSKKLPAHYNNNDLVKLVYLLVGYKALKLAVAYGPDAVYDVVAGIATAVANAIASLQAGCPACPPCNQTAADVTAL